MLRLTFLIFIGFLCSCNQNNKSKSKTQRGNPTQEAFKLTAKFNSFDTTVEVLFTETKDPINDTQKKNYDGFIEKQDLLTPDILKKVFEFYKSSYADYKKGWTMVGISNKELEKHLPTPTTPENLKGFITPALVHIQNSLDCEEGTIAIEFDCTWDIENGLGVLIKNWKVIEASVAEITYF
jgi:hypothetical protein